MQAFDVYVGYDAETSTITLDTGRGYEFEEESSDYPASQNIFGIGAPQRGLLMMGEIIGAEAGWGGNPGTGRAAAFDGNPDTFFDSADGDSFVGMRMDEEYILTEIRILPRGNLLESHNGAAIWGFEGDAFNVGIGTLIWQSDAGVEEQEWQIIPASEFIAGANTGFTSFAFYNSIEHNTVAEIELYGLPADSFAGSSGVFFTIEDAAGGREIFKNPEFIIGGPGFGTSEDNVGEGAANLFDYETGSKYCAMISDHGPFFAEWKYDEAVIVGRIIIATSNDDEQEPRRMADGWTLSGSDDGENWTVIYTGKGSDVGLINDAFFYVDVDGADAFQYFRLDGHPEGAGMGYDSDIIQVTAFILAGTLDADEDDDDEDDEDDDDDEEEGEREDEEKS
jgi:hypothetical protein